MKSKEYMRYKSIIDNKLLSYLPQSNDYNKTILSSMEYSLSAGGKRIRPILLLASHGIFSSDEKEVIDFACSVEYIHTYSLIHDDLPGIDNDDLRRGKPSNHKVFGEGIAIVAGDGLLNLAYEIMISDIQRNIDSSIKSSSDLNKRKLSALKEISYGAGVYGMVAGQALDIESGDILTKDVLNYIHQNKTGALISSAIKAGAIIGGATNSDLELLNEYANNLGLAFQIKDDLLDIYGDQIEMGKQVGSDAKLDKQTYPGIFGEVESIAILNECIKNGKNALKKFNDKADVLAEIIMELEFRP